MIFFFEWNTKKLVCMFSWVILLVSRVSGTDLVAHYMYKD